jgi:hypothetical protein
MQNELHSNTTRPGCSTEAKNFHRVARTGAAARVGWVERSETQRHESDGFQRGALLPILLELLAVYLEHDGIGRNLFARCPRSSTTPGASNSGHRVKEWVESIFSCLGRRVNRHDRLGTFVLLALKIYLLTA